MKTCCFTGSRPQNLPWQAETDPRCENLKRSLKAEIQKAIDNGYRHFISGMALGIDTYAAQIVLRIGYDNPDLGITLEAAIPCPAQDKAWLPAERKLYARLLEYCSKQTLVSNSFTRFCYQKRNEYMVDCSTLVIAVTDGRPGGTMNTIKYAKRKNVNCIILNP